MVWEGAESADDAIAAAAAAHGNGYWLVTSDRELRLRAGAGATRVIGGGAFLQDLRGG